MFFLFTVIGLCGTGTVTASVLNVRSGPGTSYSVIFQLSKGTTVTTISKTNGWYKITYNGKTGYVSSTYLTVTESTGTKGTVTASVLNIRSGPGTSYSVLFQLSSGTSVTVVSKSNGWYKINYNGNTGYASASYISTSSSSGSSSSGSSSSSSTGEKIVSYAKSKLGCKYVWGATGPSTFDCSGLVQWCHKQVGITTPRVSKDQAASGKAVSKSNLKPGDCVFFGSPVHHTGIYIGDNNFIHAPQTGDVVKITSLSRRSDYNCGRRYW